jgi:hypothetical protein
LALQLENIQVRYLRRARRRVLALAAELRRCGARAWLEYEEATDPKATAIATAKQRIYEDMVDKAAESDDMAEFPPYRRVGYLVRGRYYRLAGPAHQNSWVHANLWLK